MVPFQMTSHQETGEIQSTSMQSTYNTHHNLDALSLSVVKADPSRSIDNSDFQRAKMFSVRQKSTSSIFDEE
jgi:hypothetical protein